MLKTTRTLRAVEWSSTLRLPKSILPPRALVAKRSAYLQQCTDDLYRWQAHDRPANDQFVLHDGPPYANGGLHVGHALNKVLKDIICRFQLSAGRRVHYVPGWDCHGLPIEIKALQSQDAHIRMAPVDIREAARGLATKTVRKQKEEFRTWAIMGDWDNAWTTMQKDFELRQLGVFKEMVEKGLIYRQYKPVYWSPSSSTALAEAELEYDENHVSFAAYIKFQLVKLPPKLQPLLERGSIYAMIWTTTPWTLPANSAIAVHDDFEYSVVQPKVGRDLLLVATGRLQEILNAASLTVDDVDIVLSGIRGSDIAGQTQYINTLRGPTALPQPIIHADFVTDSSGSGLVHLAPGHGFDDYNVCRRLGIDVFAPIDDRGCFTEAAYPAAPDVLRGKEIFARGGKAVIELLRETANSTSLVWATHKHKHKYPIDWRTKKPVIIRATAQWFADVDLIKDAAITSMKNVQFLPESGRARLESFVNGRSLWCISRQRAWGVPIPALYRAEGDQLEAVMTPDTVAHIIQAIEERGIDAWWTDAEDEPAWIAPSLPSGVYTRAHDTMDVWFDSGTSWTILPANRHPPADVYIEGTDQHRGWFQSSLLTYIAHQASKDVSAPATAPYKTLITHGFILDQDGRKMSKSIGNVISPDQLMDGTLLGPMKKRKGQKTSTSPTFDAMGPDALRLWVASSDYTRDVVIGQPILQAVTTSLHKYRVTFKWLLGVLSDYTSRQSAASEPLLTNNSHLIDRLALHQLSKTSRAAYAAYTAHEPYKATSAINRYVNLDLSAFYVEAAKDPLYAGDAASRLRAQHVCYRILQGLLQMLAPTLPLLVAEVVDHAAPGLQQLLAHPERDPFKSVWTLPQLCGDAEVLDRQLKWLSEAHDAVKAAQEDARLQKKMGSGLQSRVVLELEADLGEDMVRFFKDLSASGELAEIFVVSGVEVVHRSGQGVAERSDASWVVERAISFSAMSWRAPDAGVPSRVLVLEPDMAKCPRCWRYTAPPSGPAVGGEVQHHLCGRCETVVAEQEMQKDGNGAADIMTNRI